MNPSVLIKNTTNKTFNGINIFTFYRCRVMYYALSIPIYRQMSKAPKLESRISSALLKDNNAVTDTSKKPTTAMPNVPGLSSKPQPLAKPRSFKIIVLGESGVGKTCLSFRFCAGRFPMNTEATIGLDFREKVC